MSDLRAGWPSTASMLRWLYFLSHLFIHSFNSLSLLSPLSHKYLMIWLLGLHLPLYNCEALLAVVFEFHFERDNGKLFIFGIFGWMQAILFLHSKSHFRLGFGINSIVSIIYALQLQIWRPLFLLRRVILLISLQYIDLIYKELAIHFAWTHSDVWKINWMKNSKIDRHFL